MFAVMDGKVYVSVPGGIYGSSPTPEYTFVNTHALLVDAIGEGVLITNNNCYPSDGAGSDESFSLEFWYETPGAGSMGVGRNLVVGRDDDDDDALFYLQRDASDRLSLAIQVENAGTNKLKKTTTDTLSASTLYHILVVYDGSETYAGIKIYIDGSEAAGYVDQSTGSYTGFPALVGSLELDIGNSKHVSNYCAGEYQIFRYYAYEVNQAGKLGQLPYLYNLGTPIGIDAVGAPTLYGVCRQENLFNNTPDADNIGIDGTDQGTVTYVAA